VSSLNWGGYLPTLGVGGCKNITGPESAVASIFSGTRAIKGTDLHNRPVISIYADTWTVLLRFSDKIQAYCRGISFLLG